MSAWRRWAVRFALVMVSAGIASGCAGAGSGDTTRIDLGGTAWLAEDIDGRGVIDTLQSSVAFSTDGQASGNAGCNRFFGAATIDGDRVRFGALATTRRMCPEAIMNQESRFLAALAAVRRFEMRQGLLFLFDEAGAPRLRLSRIDPPR